MTNKKDVAATNLTISVIMPVYNGVEYIVKSLPPLLDMVQRGEVAEVIVVDDTSSDHTPQLAAELGARVIPSGGRLGPGAARNKAASDAVGDLLWFVDADVIVHEDAARIVLANFKEDSIVAVFGSYDDKPPAQNFLSQYKNLVHHFYHHRGKRDASTFWSGCGIIRKDAFLAVNGFDVEKYTKPSIEDIELGYRLIAKGGRIILDPELLSTHLKVWRFVNLIETEIFCRAIPWSRLMLTQTGIVNDLNVGKAERLRAMLAGLFFLSILGLFFGTYGAVVFALVLLLVVVANSSIFSLFLRRKGILFALGGLLYHQLYYVYSSAAFVYCYIEHFFIDSSKKTV